MGAGTPSGHFTDLRVRILSAAIVAGVALLCIWLGGIWIAVLTGLATGQMMVEWAWITWRGERLFWYAAPLGMMVAIAPVATHLAGPMAGLACVAPAILWAVASEFLSNTSGFWDAVGALYIGVAGVAFVALREVEPYGFLTIVWTVVVVIAADVGGYFAGRLIGGPKLWPAVSPKKTWAGMGGGILLAVLVGWIFSGVTTGTYFQQVCAISAVAAALSQLGDLGESALKRRFGVKDAGALIPGHGGVLDRLDGHLAAVLVAAAVTFSRGQSVFVW